MQQQAARFLETLGFKDIKLVKMEGNAFTYSFTSFDVRKLVKTYGEPTLAGKGKVKVFDCKDYGRVGVSNNNFVRIVYEGPKNERVIDKSHIAVLPVNDKLQLLYQRAATSKVSQVKYVTEAWKWFNKTLFNSQLDDLVILVSDKPPNTPARGARANKFSGMYYYRTGVDRSKLWINTRLFNSDIDITNAVVVHEMCHQAQREISKDLSNDLQGHGPVWQSWMRKVGLPPNRYDHTDSDAYLTDEQQAEQDLALRDKLGPPTPASTLSKLKKFSPPSAALTASQVALVISRRLLIGKITQKLPKDRYVFRGVTSDGKSVAYTISGLEKFFKVP